MCTRVKKTSELGRSRAFFFQFIIRVLSFFFKSHTIFITRFTKTLNPEDLQQIFQCYHQGTFMLFAIQNPRRLFIFFSLTILKADNLEEAF